MKLRPDNAPFVDLSRHRRPEEFEQSSWLREIVRTLILLAFSAALYAAFVYYVLNYGNQ
jgi:hypothetical protein